jgi:hypothetical protein
MTRPDIRDQEPRAALIAKVASTMEPAPRRNAGTFMQPFYRAPFPRPNARATLALVGGGLTPENLFATMNRFVSPDTRSFDILHFWAADSLLQAC